MAALMRGAAAHLTVSCSACNGLMARHPFKTSVIVTSAKAAAADVFVQVAVEGCEKINSRRVALFATFGGCYQGCFQYFMFNIWVERLFPGRRLLPRLKKVAAVNFIGDPVFFFPTFYTMKEAFARSSSRCDEIVSLDTVRVALSNYRQNYWEDWLNTWGVWIPGHVVTYALVRSACCCLPHAHAQRHAPAHNLHARWTSGQAAALLTAVVILSRVRSPCTFACRGLPG